MQRKRRKGAGDEEEEEEEDEVLPTELTRKIIAQAREQQAEVAEEERLASRGVGCAKGPLSVQAALAAADGAESSDDEAANDDEDEDVLRRGASRCWRNPQNRTPSHVGTARIGRPYQLCSAAVCARGPLGSPSRGLLLPRPPPRRRR